MDVVSNSDASRRENVRTPRMEHLDDYNSYFGGIHNNRLGRDLDTNRQQDVRFQGDDDRNPIESLRFRPTTNQCGEIIKGPESYSSSARGGPGQGRFDHFLYHDRVPPRYTMNSYSEKQAERVRYPNYDLGMPPSIENLGNNRADLLRKLEELEDQLSRSSDGTEKPMGRTGTDQRMISSTSYDPYPRDPYPRNHTAYVQEGLISSHGVNKQALMPDDMVSPYLSQSPGRDSLTNRHSPFFSDSYPQRGFPHEMSRKPPHQPQSQYSYRPYHEHIHGYHGNVNHDHYVLHPHEYLFDHPACNCVQCFNRNSYLTPKADLSSSYSRRTQNELSSPDYHHYEGSQEYSPGGINLYSSHTQQSVALNSSEVESVNDGFNHSRPRYEVETHRKHIWYPISGGAPIIACFKCFGLLKLPRKHLALAKSQHKLKCGVCSSLILLELGNRGSTMPAFGHFDHVPAESEDTSTSIMDENIRIQHGVSNHEDKNVICNDFDDSDSKVSPAEKKLNSGESEKQLDRLSSASTLSEGEQNPETLASGKHGSPSAELDVTAPEPFSQPCLFSEECIDQCSANIVLNKFDKGNKSKRSDLEQNTPCQNFVEDSVLATEMDISLNSGVSQDFVDQSEELRPMVNKGREPFFAGVTRTSSRDFTEQIRNLEIKESQVFVNGRYIPEHLVQKAEKLAGPIEHGEYWYDVHAGFWGVMGYPCLGIIMPNIEEFNYPMPEDCAAGNTGVFVNGRELHHKDLAMLASRGLPDAKHGSYIIDISGKVVDDETGEELHNLGKLAPTVERAQHGFGMKVPSFIARLQY